MTIQNFGRDIAEWVEIVHRRRPDFFQLYPSLNYTETTTPAGEHVLRVESVAPKVWTRNGLQADPEPGRHLDRERTTPIFDAAGNLYGSVAYGGAYGCATIYKLTPGPGNEWTYSVIHHFNDDPACSPWVGLIPDTIGNLYGTTRNTVGGCTDPPQECGTVFKLTPNRDGTWAFKVIHQFSGDDGSDPSVSELIFDEAGNLYGLTQAGGRYSTGVSYKLALGENDSWAQGHGPE